MSFVSRFFAGNDGLARAALNSPAIAMGSMDLQAVRLIQMALVALGHPMPRSTKPNGTLDGIFGAETHKGVVAYQLKNGLSADGVVGKNTVSRMDGQVANVLPDPPTNPDLKLPASYYIPRPVERLRQPDSASCWATSATILEKWNHPGKFNKYVNEWPVQEQIELVLTEAGKNVGSRPPDYFVKEFRRQKGLRTDDNELLYVQGLKFTKFTPPMSRFSDPFNCFRGAYSWMGLLAWARRPLAVNVMSYLHLWNHWLLVTGVDLTSSMENRFAAKSQFPFLNVGIIHYYDPFHGNQAIMSSEDIDYLVGPLPNFASLSDQHRARVFF